MSLREADSTRESKEAPGQTLEEEEVDIDLSDPDVEKSAIKIQASFKGFQARKELKKARKGAEEKVNSQMKKNVITMPTQHYVDVIFCWYY